MAFQSFRFQPRKHTNTPSASFHQHLQFGRRSERQIILDPQIFWAASSDSCGALDFSESSIDFQHWPHGIWLRPSNLELRWWAKNQRFLLGNLPTRNGAPLHVFQFGVLPKRQNFSEWNSRGAAKKQCGYNTKGKKRKEKKLVKKPKRACVNILCHHKPASFRSSLWKKINKLKKK